jgi:hypothetical protein
MQHNHWSRRPVRAGFIALIVALLAGAWVQLAPVQAQSGNSWRIDYFNNTDWAGAPVYTEYTNVLSHNWGTAAPGPNMPSINWTARMTSQVFFYAGVYRLSITADDEFALVIDGVTYFSTLGQGLSGKTVVVDVSLNQGTHDVMVNFRQFTGSAYFVLDWSYMKDPNYVYPGVPVAPTPAPTPTPVPPAESPTSVVTQYGDYTRCIQFDLHQSECFQSSGQWDSPNLGSIETEPKIVVWGNCTGDTVQTMQLYANQPPQPAKCSKTEAGWFPN